MSKKWLSFLLAATLVAFPLFGCKSNIQATDTPETTAVEEATAPEPEETSDDVDSPDTISSSEDSNTLGWTEFDAVAYPNYVKLYDIPCTVDIELQPGEIQFSEVDDLGRSGRAVGNITAELVQESAGWRTEFAPNSNPSGWGHNEEVEITFPNHAPYHGWMWNRSHLIADSLGGYTHVYNEDGSINEDESTTPKTNLVTGTRTQNVGDNDGEGGMAFFERKTVDWLNNHPEDTVWYSARPVYEGDELVPRSVIVSLTNPDHTFEYVGEVFNAANGYTIDYTNGTFAQAE